LALLATFACSSTHNNGPTDAGGTPGNAAIDEACAADADSWCGPLDRCAPFTMQLLYGDKAACIARDKLWCTPFLQTSDSETPDQMKACAAALAAQSCDEFYAGITPDACKLPPGVRADGATCQNGTQCQSTHCKVATGSACGVCAQKVPEGGHCDHSSDCVDRYCRRATMTCVKLPSLDQPCTGTCSFSDGINLTCVFNADGSGGVCKTAIQAGGACDPMADACDLSWNSLICDSTTRTCKPSGIVAGPGQSCESGNCSADGRCTASDDGGAPVCVPPPADGATCDPVQSPCNWPAQCVNNKCQLPAANQCQ
jgi:hypothetical protein